MSAQITLDEYLQSVGAEDLLTPQDARELQSGERRVLALMSDLQPHSADEVCWAAGNGKTPAREGLRRLRRLRSLGYCIDKVQVGNRQWNYVLKGFKCLVPK